VLGVEGGLPVRPLEGVSRAPLDLAPVRELLQRRVLLRPLVFEGTGPVILQLTDAGAVLEIPVPQGEPRPPGGEAKAGEASQRKRGKSQRRPRASGEATGRTPEERAAGARTKPAESPV